MQRRHFVSWPLRDSASVLKGSGDVPGKTLSDGETMLLRAGNYYYLKTGMLTALKDDGIDLIIDSFKRMPDWYLMFDDYCWGAY
jgi:hypothetical protein